jgi:hypothetical protein
MSASAAAIALGIIGSVAAAPVTPKTSATPKPGTKPSPSKKRDAPKLSKWQQHVRDMLRISAPGDEYFGRMKMSYLGINNTFRDDLVRAGDYTTDPKLLSGINFADEALSAWARKYPNDPQLARSYFLAFQMYRKVWVKEYQDKAWQYAHIVTKKWPKSFFGKALQKDLAIGFTERYFATPLPCEVLAAVSPSASPASTRATPAASPSLTPSPMPTPTPAPGMPKVEILPAPCLTPTPSPTPVPSLTPLPSATLSPLPSGSLLPSPLPTPTGLPAATAGPSVTPVPASSASPTPTARPAPPATPTPLPSHRPFRR